MASNQQGIIYLLHFDTPYKHARHYLGWTADLGERLEAHSKGEGARLMAVVKEAGITWYLSRVWLGTRSDERKLKKWGGSGQHCPSCKSLRHV